MKKYDRLTRPSVRRDKITIYIEHAGHQWTVGRIAFQHEFTAQRLDSIDFIDQYNE